MSQDDIAEEQEAFQRCLDAPSWQWDEILENLLGDKPEQREHVRRMLRHHTDTNDSAGSFLDRDKDPDRIGPYRVLQRLGEGGMGIVYAAEQREPVRRRVAIKVLRGGYNNREVLARFDVERQAMALMNHVNIARILDAGTTADHRPYIVMEYVHGESITHYCERFDLPLRDRLVLFREVCDAVQHAHQRGVIHRDLKPSNILIMEEDGKAVAKVIDFGIAKAIAQRLTDQTLETKVGSLLGTPDYMSPEQAELSPLDVDTRSDVYALGAVLYQLLTGVTPLSLSDSRKNFSEMQRLINEQQPLPPSHRVRGPLQKQLRGELDWITLKALEKQRNHRYDSAADLARDIRAWLEDDTVHAGPPSRVRKARKFIRRHWLGVSALLVVALVMTVSQILLVQKNAELEEQRDRANREANIAKRVTDFTAGLIRNTGPSSSGSTDISARELLDAGVEQIDREMQTEPAEVRAALYGAASNTYRDLGEYSEAIRLQERAVALRKENFDTAPAEYATALLGLAMTAHMAGDSKRAESLTQEIAELHARVAQVRDQWPLSAYSGMAFLRDAQGHHDEAGDMLLRALQSADRNEVAPEEFSFAHAMLGRIRRTQGRFEEAEAWLKRAIELEAERSTASTQESRDAKAVLAGLYMEIDNPARAVPLQRQLVEERRAVYGEMHPEYASALNNLGRGLETQPETQAEAEQLFLQAIKINTAVLGEAHPYTLIMRGNLAALYGLMGDWQRSRERFEADLELLQATQGDDAWQTANAKFGLARALLYLEQPAEAELLLHAARPSLERQFGVEHWRVANLRHMLGLALLEQEQVDEAELELQSAHAVLARVLGPEHSSTRAAAADLARLRGQR